MKCLNCGFVYDNEFATCPNCGATAPEAEPINFNPIGDRVSAALKDNLFLALCISVSVSTLFSILGGGLPVITILLTIFLWITYSKTLRNEDTSETIRCISGTVYAQYIIDKVSAILCIVSGVLFFIVKNNILNELEKASSNSEFKKLLEEFPAFTEIAPELLIKLMGPCFIIIGVVTYLINFFGMKKIHRFVKSTYQGMNFKVPFLENPKATRNWLIVFTVMYGLSTLGSMPYIVSLGANGGIFVALIITVILMNKYFITDNEKI